MSDTIEQIKSRLDVVDVISGYIKLQRSGVNFKARCPFHNEKTPSFYISPERQIWHCFGCSKGGDMFGFIKEIEGVEFPEALRILAQKAGVELAAFDPAIRNEKTKLYEICETAARFFEKQLHQSQTGQKALAYLKDRGLSDETIKEFRLGFAPDDWHALGTFLNQCGYTYKEITDAGLMVAKEDRHYDRFRSRITFPIFDLNGQIVGFTGRVFDAVPTRKAVGTPTSDSDQAAKGLDENQSVGAKYINTPQTLIYDKSRILYGLHRSKMEVKSADQCVLVEGNMDALMSHQGGVRNVIATSGTALTQEQLRLLQRYTTNLNFCFDADQAGALATRRGIGLALGQNFTVRVTELNDPECKDPADYVKRYGAKWGDVVRAARPVIEYYFEKARRTFDPASAESKKSLLAAVAPLVRRLASRVEQAHWVGQLAAFLRVPEQAVQADITGAKDDLGAYDYQEVKRALTSPANAPVQGVPVSIDLMSEALFSLVLRNPALFTDDLHAIDVSLLDPQIGQVIAKLAGTDVASLDIGAFLRDLRQENESYRFEFAYLKSQELWKDFNDAELQSEFRTLWHKIKRRSISAQLTDLEFDIKDAETQKNAEKMSQLMAQFTQLTRQLAEIQKA